jgi:hypothetical protein
MRITPGLRAAALVVAFAWRTDAAQAQLTALGSQYWDQDSPGIADAAQSNDAFGSSLAAGDFDCDGYEDLAIGVPFEDVTFDGASQNSAGAVHVLFGGPQGLASGGRDQFLTEATPTFFLEGFPEPGDHFGYAVAAYRSSGTCPRLAVGAPDEDISGAQNTGWVFLFRWNGSSHSLEGFAELGQSLIVDILADEEGDQFGSSLAAVDFTAFDDCLGINSLPGLAIGAPGEAISLFGHDQGAVYVARGRFCPGDDPYEWENDLCGSPGVGTPIPCLTFHQDVPGFGSDPEDDDRFGEAISGRVRNRLIIASPGEDNGQGKVQVVYNYSTNIDVRTLTQSSLDHGASEDFDRFGAALVEGDFDGDNRLDLAIGLPGEDVNSNAVVSGGAIAVVYSDPGTPVFLPTTGDDFFDQDSFAGTSAEDNDRFGTALAAGDFDGDGIDDLAIGVPNEDVGATVDGGAFNILYGSGTGLTTTGNQTFTQNDSQIPGSSEEGDTFGAAIAAGNFDGANGADLAVGVPGENGVCQSISGSPPFPDNNEGGVNVLYGTLNGSLSQISASFSPSPVSEGAGSSTLTLTKTGSSVIAASIHIQTSPDTAKSNIDFVPLNLDAAWPAGDGSVRTVDLDVIDNPNDQPSRSLDLHLLAPSPGATVVGGATIALTILDDDTFTSFADDFEASATGAWTSSFSTTNTLAQSALARYAGDSGLRVLVNDPSAVYLQDELPFSSSYHARFYLRLVPLAMANLDSFVVFSGADPDGANVFKVHVIGAGADRYLRAIAYTDTGSSVAGGFVLVPPGRHAIEISWQRGAAGQLTLKIDGQLEDSITGVANNTLRVDRVRLGAAEGFDAGTTGNFALDEFASSASVNLNQISAFLDVAKADPLWNFIHSMYNFEVTEGCQTGLGPLNFCKNDPVTREALAMLLIRASDGPAAPNPASCGAAPFTDVAAGNTYCRFIQEIDNRGITNGCGGTSFCPKNPIRRGELAVLLLRAVDGGGTTPAPCATKPFTDVETTDPRCPFIQEIKQRSISNGCGGANYCPDQPVRRQELAILLQRAFGYRLPVSP